jgi:hypothetical protein
MSSIKDKKAALIAKIQRQKEKQKKQIYTIPTIKLSSADANRKAMKTFIPTDKSLFKKSINEDSMREFLTEVNNLNVDDFKSNDSYTQLVDIGYKLYISVYTKDFINAADDVDTIQNLNDIKSSAKAEWLELPLYKKMIWVIKGYGNKEDAEWGRKQFSLILSRTIYNEDNLRKFIEDYLIRDISYDKFIDHWKSQQSDEELKESVEREIAISKTEDKISLQGTREEVTEEDQNLVKDMRERLKGYEDALEKLSETEYVRERFLQNLSHEEMVDLVSPIMGRKTKEELIRTIIAAEFIKIKRDKYKEVFGRESGKYLSDNEKLGRSLRVVAQENEEFTDFLKELDNEENTRVTELNEMSYRDILLESINNKTSPKLVQLLLYDEFYKSRYSLQNKISTLIIDIHNLKLGKYIPRTGSVKTLRYKERKYRESLFVKIRRIELETKTLDQLRLISGLINALPKRIIGGIQTNVYTGNISKKELITLILQSEFPDFNVDDISSNVTHEQMKSVLLTLEEDQIHILAYSSGIERPEKRGKHNNIDYILSKEFPYKKIPSIEKLVVGKYSKNFDIINRRNILENMQLNDLKNEALVIGIELPKGTTTKYIINRILSWEEYNSKLITKEQSEKERIIEKISKITGSPPERYSLWSYNELTQRLVALKDESQEYWKELEQERLYTKLSGFVNVNDSKYKKIKTWSLRKLQKELKEIGGEDWETYKPIIEDYSFVKCMDKYNTYDWIDGKVTATWLCSPEDTVPDIIDYIREEISIEENGRRWYQANKKYFALQCNKYKNKRVQKDDVLISMTHKREIVKLMVGYTVTGNNYSSSHMVKSDNGNMVKRTFIIQDEVLFNKEKKYERISNQSEYEQIQDVLNSTVTEKSAEKVRTLISKELLNIAPMKKDYGIVHFSEGVLENTKKDSLKMALLGKNIDSNTPYMQILMQSLRENPEQTNKELFTRAANIVVYLTTPEAKTFINNIEKEYYLPDILATLSPSEKFPEVYQDPKLSGTFLDQITAIIDNKIYKLVYNLGSSEYKSMDSTRSIKTSTISTAFIRSIKTNKRLSACENNKRVKNVPDSEIIYYSEGDTIYCFSVEELYDRLVIQEDIINPETNNKFDIEFVRRFGELYNKKLADDGLLSNYFQKKYGFDMDSIVKEKEIHDTKKREFPSIALDLWEKIGRDIGELEDQLTNKQPKEDDYVDTDREDERREVEVEEGLREDVNIDENDACVYCKNHLSDDSIKSIIYHNDESRIIKFCSFKCFENKNDWKKYKIKKDKTINKSIKSVKKLQKKAKKDVKEKEEKISYEPVKLTKKEQKTRKKIINKQIKEGVAAFDKVAFPLMTKTELKSVAKEKGITIPGNISKMGTAAFLYRKLHPNSKKGVLKERTAAKEMTKIETRRDKKKRNEKELKN